MTDPALRRIIDLDPDTDWPATIEAAPPGAVARFRPGVYGLDRTITLADRRDLVLQGAGPDRTRIVLAGQVPIGFELARNVVGLSIGALALIGSLRSHEHADAVPGAGGAPGDGRPVGTHAIASFSGAEGIRGVTLHDLAIRRVAVGIGLAGDWRHTAVIGCQIADCFGTATGRGYGIVASGAKHLAIVGNTITRCGRHGIYQGGSPGPVWIEANTIIDHRLGLVVGDYLRPALVVARSSRVTARSNAILRPHDAGLSVEADELDPQEPIQGVRCIGNTFAEGQPGLPYAWINAGPESEPVVWLDNVMDAIPAEPIRIDSGSLGPAP